MLAIYALFIFTPDGLIFKTSNVDLKFFTKLFKHLFLTLIVDIFSSNSIFLNRVDEIFLGEPLVTNLVL